MIVQQHEDREAAADAIEYAIANVETPAHADGLRRVVAKVMAKLDAKMPPPITCHCCGEPPIIPRGAYQGYRGHCACIDAMRLALAHKRELATLNEVLARKNRELDALHFVWCDGACEGGTHRHGGELTQEIVEEAERNTARLRRRWDGIQRKASDALDAAEEREAVTR